MKISSLLAAGFPRLSAKLCLLLAASLLLIPVGRVRAQAFTTLHSFTGGSDGYQPNAGLILSGNTLYGTSPYAGLGFPGYGTVFAVNTDGTGFTTLYSFTGLSDGAQPDGGVILSGNTLYGTASGGGTSGDGTVFAVNTDGTGFTTLHSFFSDSNGHNPEGRDPEGALILSGNTLYGTAAYGGAPGGYGTVFAVNTDGTGFTVLHSFGNSDGAHPVSGLILSGNTLYGTAANTPFGGGPGTVFAVNTDGTGFTILHTFTGGSDGAFPYAGLILLGNTLYGPTADTYGTVFAVNTDGTGFTTLYTFTGGSDGESPLGVLILSGNTLYGTAFGGGASGWGTVFAVNTDGTGFTTLYSFTDGNDGAGPAAGLILSGNTLYGTAEGGGTSGDGTVFSLSTSPSPTPTPTPTAASPTPTPTAASPTPTPTAASPTPTPTAASPTPTPTAASPTPTPTAASPTPTPTAASPTPTPTAASPTPTPTAASPTPTPTAAPTPAAPVALKETNVTASSFTANWRSVSGATGYRLDVSTSSTFASYVPGYQDRNVGNVTSQNVTGLAANTFYYYRARAYNGNGTSPNSNVIKAKTKNH